jgi:hypothetical protein
MDVRALVVWLPTAEEAKEGQQRGAAAERTSDDRGDLLLGPKRDVEDKGEMVQRTQQPIVSVDASASKKEGRKGKKKTEKKTKSSTSTSSIKKRKKDSTLPSEHVPISAVATENEREVGGNRKKQRKAPSTALDLDITMDIVTTEVEPEKPMAEGATSAAVAADYDDNVWDEHDVIEMDDDKSDAGGAQPMLNAVTTTTTVTATSAEAVWSEAGECSQRSAPTAEASIQADQAVSLNADHNDDDVAISKRTPVGLDLNLELDLPDAPPEPAPSHLKPKTHPKEEMDSEAQLWAAAIKAHKVSTVGTVAETCLLLAIVIN